MGCVNRNLISCAAFMAILLVSCAQPNTLGSAEPTGKDFDLNGTEWVLNVLKGEPLLEDTNITLDFDDNSLGGYAGCNMYGSPYKVTAMTLSVESIYSDAQGCTTPTGVMRQEEAYHRALYQATIYRVADNRLELANGAGDVTLVFIQRPQLPMNPADLVGTK